MTDQQLIERVVREVLRQLGLLAGTNSADAAVTAAADSPAAPNGQQRLEIPQRVVTLAVLRGQLNGVRMLIVRPDAVVTPAVRDELRDRQIDLQRGGSSKL